MNKKILFISILLVVVAIVQNSCQKKKTEYKTRISGDSLFIQKPTLVVVPWSVVSQGTPEDAAMYREIEEKSKWYRAKFGSEKLEVYFGQTQLVTFQDTTGEMAPVFTNLKMDGYELAIFDAQGKPHYVKSWDHEQGIEVIMDSLKMPINPAPAYVNSLTKAGVEKK